MPETNDLGPRPWLTPQARVFLGRWGAAGIAAISACIITGRAHWHFIRPYATPVSNDEGYIAAMALRLVHGHWLPYVDGVSQRGPVTYWIATVAMSIGGLFSWAAMRWLALIVAFCNLALVFFTSVELFTPIAAGIAVLFVTYFLTYELNPWDGLGYNGEIVAMQFVLLSALTLVRIQRRPAAWRTRGLIAAGAFAALAGLSKQMTLLHAGPGVLWILLGTQHTASDDTPKGRLRDLGKYLLGFVVPFVLVIGLYTATGHLREFLYYYQRYGRDIFMAPLTRDFMRDKIREQIDKYFLGIVTVSTVGLVAVARMVREWLGAPGHGRTRVRPALPGLFVVLQLTAGTLGACFTWRFFPHYFVEVYPMAALAAGYAAGQMFEPQDDTHWPNVASALVVILGATVLLGVASSALTRVVRQRRETDRWYQEPQADPIVRYVLEKSRPTDTIFVWGFRAETYVSAHRYPASRYVYTVYPAGVVPWFQSTREQEEQRQVPGSRDILLHELDTARPELVIDAGRSMNGRYMYNYPVLRTYLDRHYCFMRYVDGEPVYRRRHGDHCPPADY